MVAPSQTTIIKNQIVEKVEAKVEPVAPTPAEPQIPNDPEGYAHYKVKQVWGEKEWDSFYQLIDHESGWMIGRLNKSSLACSIGQALPCTKIYPQATKEWIKANKRVETINGRTFWFLPNPDTKQEIDWTITYIQKRYGSPQSAWSFWKSHNWY
jgi:hypothetical protein